MRLPLLVSRPAAAAVSRAAVVVLSTTSDDGTPTRTDELGATALLVGTAIGGGFLALPYTTAPSGGIPSAAVLTGCWAWLLTEALLISDLVIDGGNNGTEPISFASLGREAFGEAGGFAVSATFVVLMVTTLVSQFAKGGELLGAALPFLPATARCLLLAASVAAFARGAPLPVISRTNGLLTLGFVAATANLFWAGLPQAVWPRLARADWSVALAGLPTLLQLHVYCEVVPSICEALHGNRRAVRRAIMLGSVALLALQLFWSCLGIALVAPTPTGGLRSDPVALLLSGGGTIAVATAATAAFAILTTILGTSRALYSFCVDATRARSDGSDGSDGSAATATTDGGVGSDGALAPAAPPEKSNSWWRRLGGPATLLYAAVTCVPAVVAGSAASADAFFGAIDFAGAYPVALLWGLAPPLMALRSRSQRRSQGLPAGKWNAAWSKATLLGLAALSALFIGGNLLGDLSWLLAGAGRARWQ